jgi:hypothetical protein
MKNAAALFLIISLLSLNTNLFADSPLTSTNFSSVYQNEKIVIESSKTSGILTQQLIVYLLNKKNPVDIKMAVINELSWDMNGKNNSTIFLNYLIDNNLYKNKADFIQRGKIEELLCMAYLKGLDDYFNVDEAVEYADAVLARNPKSYTVNIICALIKAQKEFEISWCEVYKTTNRVRINKSLKLDMKKEATDIIFEYMDLYKAEC